MVDAVACQSSQKDRAELYDGCRGTGKYLAKQKVFGIDTCDKHLDGAVAFLDGNRGGNHNTVQNDHHEDNNNESVAVPVIITGILAEDTLCAVDRSIIAGREGSVIQIVLFTVDLLMNLRKKALEDRLILIVHVPVQNIIFIVQIVFHIKSGRDFFGFDCLFQLFFAFHCDNLRIGKYLL